MRFFDDVLLENFMNQFYGYGEYEGDCWLVGMEEGGGNSFEDIERRLTTWRDRGQKELENIAEYHIDLGITSLFREKPKIQRTWGKLIRIIMSLERHSPTTNEVRDYQRDCLGQPSNNNCLLELLPLPSPSVGHWLYSKHSKLPYLRSRESYREIMIEKRIDHFQKRLREYAPKLVIFYSFSYRQHWEAIIGEEFSEVENEDYFIAGYESQIFVMIKHPAARGLSNDYFHKIGFAVADRLA